WRTDVCEHLQCLVVDGFLTAKGGKWGSVAAGGGSGGSQFLATGGDGYEPGGPGTVYLHRLQPDNQTQLLDATSEEAQVTHDSNVTQPLTNRTLYINNLGKRPRDPERNLSSLPREHLQIRLGSLHGDRSGKIHIGFNQTLYAANAHLPMDLTIYPGGLTTTHGELRAAGVTVDVQGVVANCENITVVDGGIIKMHEMIDLHGHPTETFNFNAIEIRNHGTLQTSNGQNRRVMKGTFVQAPSMWMGVGIQLELVQVQALHITTVEQVGAMVGAVEQRLPPSRQALPTAPSSSRRSSAVAEGTVEGPVGGVLNDFDGSLDSSGGEGQGEHGASGTVFFKQQHSAEKTTLKIYNGYNQPSRRTWIPLPEDQADDHILDVLDIGGYSHVSLLSVDEGGLPVSDSRTLHVRDLAGDHTGTVHVDHGEAISISLNATHKIPFNVNVYQNGTLGLPHHTYLQDTTLTLYGGKLLGVQTLNISLDGKLDIKATSKINTETPGTLVLNSITVLNGGVLSYLEGPEDEAGLMVQLDGSFTVRGGAEVAANKLYIKAVNISVDGEGKVDASGHGWPVSQGPGAGLGTSYGSGASHGGGGGQGQNTAYSAPGYGNVLEPVDYGSGGSRRGGSTEHGGSGGGVLRFEAENHFLLDGELLADGLSATSTGNGGGSGGSIWITTRHLSGRGRVSVSGGDSPCVANCNRCVEGRCLQCKNQYYWKPYDCVRRCDDWRNEAVGGGGAGGRVAVYSNVSDTFRGQLQALGGASDVERGGPGTVFTSNPLLNTTSPQTTLLVDNGGYKPKTTWLTNSNQDSGRAYITTQTSNLMLQYEFDHVHLSGGGHLAFHKDDTILQDIPIHIGHLHGDGSGVLHTSPDHHLHITDSNSPFPAGFRSYENSYVSLPKTVYLADMDSPGVHVDGTLDGLEDLTIGSGITLTVGGLGGTSGALPKTLQLKSLQIFTDGQLESYYPGGSKRGQEPSLSLQITDGIHLHAGGAIKGNWVHMSAETILVDTAAEVDTSGAGSNTDGEGIPAARGASGGGHGGSGGQGVHSHDYSIVGPPYGSLYEPQDFGSPGGVSGLTSSSPGQGGGVITMVATRVVEIDGSLHADGTEPMYDLNGGGSGGSVYINTTTFKGTGLVSTNGGSSPSGGGGGGGRVAIHSANNTFSGVIQAFGGRSSYEVGGAGTILLRDTDAGQDTIIVDNEDRGQPRRPQIDFSVLDDQQHKGEDSARTWLVPYEDQSSFTFKEMSIRRGAHLSLFNHTDGTQYNVRVNETSGDKTGMMHVGPSQILHVSQPPESPDLMWNVLVYPGGQLEMSEHLEVRDMTLTLAGDLLGAQDVTIGHGGKLILRPQTNATWDSTRYITFQTVTIEGGGELSVESDETGLFLNGQLLHVHSGGRVTADKLSITATNIIVEQAATIDLSGKAPVAGHVAGRGTNGAGAGHGGNGGRSRSRPGAGRFYGDLSEPDTFGSSATLNGVRHVAGGGSVTLSASNMIRLDGTIRGNGADGAEGSGGASGGSILIRTDTFEGTGSIECSGGQGDGSDAGGGSGGRVAVHYTSSTFQGNIVAYGGQSSIEAGAAGTVLLESGELWTLKVDNNGQTVYQENIGDFFDLSDVSGRTWVNVPPSGSYNFATLDLRGNAHLAFDVDAAAPNLVRYYTVQKLVGDRTGDVSSLPTLNVGPGQMITIQRTDYYLPINFKVHKNGELSMPSSIMLHKGLNIVEGTLSGISELTVADSTLTFGGEAETATSDQDHPILDFTTSLTVGANAVVHMTGTESLYELKAQTLTVQARGRLVAKRLQDMVPLTTTLVEVPAMLDWEGRDHTPVHMVDSTTTLTCLQLRWGLGVVVSNLVVAPEEGLCTSLQVQGGKSAPSSNCGGGSGGSIWVESPVLVATGTFNVSGGHGISNGGGGGGGYISLHVNYGESTLARASLVSRGGLGHNNGGPGIVYIKDTTSDSNFDKVIVNAEHLTSAAAILDPGNRARSLATLQELELLGGAELMFPAQTDSPVPLTVTINNLLGDRSSTLRVGDKQEVHIMESSHVDELDLPASIEVSQGGVIYTRPKILLRQGVTLDLCGKVSDISEITVRSGGSFLLSYPGYTGDASPGTVNMDTLKVYEGGRVTRSIKCQNPTNVPMELQVTSLYEMYGSHFISDAFSPLNVGTHHRDEDVGDLPDVMCPHGTNFNLMTGQSCTLPQGTVTYQSLTISGGAVMTVSGDPTGHSTSHLIVNGDLIINPGGSIHAAAVINATVGSGVVHGGTHGGQGGGSVDTVHGSITSPEDYGTAGKGTGGGQGGGQIKITVHGNFINDGVVEADGGDHTSSGAGGGSGGSIFITAAQFSGGSTYKGVFSTAGGDGNVPGGPGTIFVRVTSNGIAHNTLIIDGSTDTNTNSLPTPTTSEFATVDEVQVIRYGTLGVTSNLHISKLTGDGTGKIVVSSASTTTIADFANAELGTQCAFRIEAGGNVEITKSATFTGEQQPLLDIAGVLTISSTVVHANELILHPNSHLMTSELHLLQSSSAIFDNTAKISPQGQAPVPGVLHVDRLSLGVDTTLDLRHYESNVTVQSTQLQLRAGSRLKSSANETVVLIEAGSVEMERGSAIEVVGTGYVVGPGYPCFENASICQSGANHGGTGGNAVVNSQIYGSVSSPSSFGSGTGTNVRGGGALQLVATESLKLDGLISASGMEKTFEDGYYLGGGSGGSIWITTAIFQGHGLITSDGGAGNVGYSSGGGGGRIAINAGNIDKFTGKISTFGGAGKTNGAAGTIFFRSVSFGLQHDTVVVDNNNQPSGESTFITSQSGTTLTINILQVQKMGRVEFVTSVGDTDVTIHNLLGDFSGTVTVLNNQTLAIGQNSGTNQFMTTTSLVVQEGGKLILPQRVLFSKSTTGQQALTLRGTLRGLQEVTVGEGASVLFESTARTALGENVEDDRGSFTFGTVEVMQGGRFDLTTSYQQPTQLTTLTALNVRYGGTITGRWLIVKSPSVSVGLSGSIASNGLGFGGGEGLGAGVSGLTSGSGGSHGGWGGSTADNSNNPVSSYGTLYEGTEFGSGGGNGPVGSVGGAGGGIITIESNSLQLDGQISSEGVAGSGSAGGGSGGTVHLVLDTLTGSGEVNVKGGNAGDPTSGSGGGGRVSIFLTSQSLFTGSYKTCGGSAQRGSQAGSAGTVFIKEMRGSDEYTTLILDNSCMTANMSCGTVLNETEVLDHHFNELHVLDNVILHVEGFNVTVAADRLYSDVTSTIHIHDTMVLTVDTSLSESSPECSFALSEQGELRLPPTVTFLGPSNSFAGMLTNIFDMVIAPHQEVILSPVVRTAMYSDGRYTFITEPGAYKLASLHVKDHAKLTFESDADSEGKMIDIGLLEVNYGGVVTATSLHMRGNEVRVHAGAMLDLSGGGNGAEEGPGAGMQVDQVGVGAGYGGFGGSPGDSTLQGGSWYDSVQSPSLKGSGGGNSGSDTGGAGGGYLYIQLNNDLTLEGSIDASGEHGQSNAGGGSGGGVYIAAYNMKGHGSLKADGGSSQQGVGGGGSGGRIAIYTQQHTFESRPSVTFATHQFCLPLFFSYQCQKTYMSPSGSRQEPARDLTAARPNCKSRSAPYHTPHGSRRATDRAPDGYGFPGEVTAYGGSSRDYSAGGAPGTVFIKDNLSGYSSTRLMVQSDVSESGKTQANTVIAEEGEHYRYDEFIIKGDCNIVFNGSTSKVYLKKLIADKLATVNIVGQQLFYPKLVEASPNAGGSHASAGGVGNGEDLSTASPPYGTIYSPALSGTNGGGSGGGRGGSFIRIYSLELEMDGQVKANGQSVSSVHGGGGSGGSIWINAEDVFKGFGSLHANGGDGGSSASGGGSGGRIAVHTAGVNIYHGKYHAMGGSGPGGAGGAGSIFLRHTDGNKVIDILMVDNDNRQEDIYFTLDEGDNTKLQELHVNNVVKFDMPTDSQLRSLNVHRLVGDGTAFLHVHANQTYLVDQDGDQNETTAKIPANLKIDHHAELITSSRTQISGKGNVALEWAGALRAVRDFVIDQDCVAFVHPTATIYNSIDQINAIEGQLSFANVELYAGSTVRYVANTGAKIDVGNIDIKFGAQLEADWFDIGATSIHLEVGSTMTCSGSDRSSSEQLDIDIGSGSYYSSGDSGAGHGSYGGRGHSATVSGGQPYGSLYHPNMPGSRGSSRGGKGGGRIYIDATDVINDGLITVKGASPDQSDGGAGSGGSIWIETEKNVYDGTYLALGGDGTDSSTQPRGGGPGTVFLQETRNGYPHRQLRINNQDRPFTQYVSLAEGNVTDYVFDQVHLTHSASLDISVAQAAATLTIYKVQGDGTGVLHSHAGHQFVIEFVDSTTIITKARVNYIIDEGSEVILPATVHVNGMGIQHGDKKVAMELNGRLTNVAHLVISKGSSVHFSTEAHAALFENGTYTFVGQPGDFLFATLQLKTESALHFAPNMSMVGQVGEIDVKYGAKILAEGFQFLVSRLNIEAGGTVSCSAGDRPQDTLDSLYGAGLQSSQGGSGGGHASMGGTGGNSNLGGGGSVHLEVAEVLHLDGLISASGGEAETNTRGGGGSGGSIWVTAGEIEGHGSFSSHGGDGDANGGGGSGGRMAIYTNSKNEFKGSYDALGGDGGHPGGPGSVYLQDIRDLRPYTQLRIDNVERDWDIYFTLDEPNINNYTFDEVHIVRKASLQMPDDDGIWFVDEPGTFKFASLEFGSQSQITFPPPMGITFTVGFLDMKWACQLHAEFFNIYATDFFLEPSATVTSAGRGYDTGGPGQGTDVGSGAGHATHGGNGTGSGTVGGGTYGFLYRPVTLGSRGGSGSNNLPGPRGGGRVRIIVGAIFILDGEVNVDGDSAGSGTRAGGGSGGSAWITSGHIRGHGLISSRGGQGDHNAGGGAGGRIALHCSNVIEYRGALQALGEKGTTNGDFGGSGTVYLEDLRNGTYFRRLYIDNQDVVPPKAFVLQERHPIVEEVEGYEELNEADFAFDQVMLQRKAIFQIGYINKTTSSVSIYEVLGDLTSILHICGNQTFFIEYEEAEVHRAEPPVNFIIDQHGELYAPNDFRVIGLRVPAVYLDGRLTGVYNLSIAGGKVMTVGPHATNALVKNRTYTETPVPARIEAESLLIQASNLNIEGEASMVVSGRGYMSGLGEVPGIEDEAGYGTGGGHGGYGGGTDISNKTHGGVYGSYSKPVHWGSGGGGTHGGAGGSAIEIHAGHSIHLDGTLETMGESATGSNSGGGSGGSVYLTTVIFSGHGSVNADGGNGVGYGYGGAVEDAGNGAGGTVFYTDTNQGLQHRKASYDPNQNTTLWQDAFSKLLLDNDNRNDILPTVIMNENGTYFEFDEIETKNHVVLWLHGGSDTLVAHKFVGDRTGQVHLRPGQKMYCEVVESQTGYTVAPVSYKIDAGAEIFFPSSLTLLGTRTTIEGVVTGVYDIFLAKGARTTFASTTQTGIMINQVYDFLTSPGNITFGTMTVQRGERRDLGQGKLQQADWDMVLAMVDMGVLHTGILVVMHMVQ
ncbi:hypothetical protein Bbelb_437250, partial [Branchiostoma belcheri]